MKPGTKPIITKQKFIEALPNTAGLYTLIAERLDCSRITVWKFLKKHPELEKEVEAERERIIDLAEGNLIEKIIKKKDFKAIKYFLSTKAKSRGYSQKLEVENSGEVAVKGYVTFNPDEWDKKKKEEVEE